VAHRAVTAVSHRADTPEARATVALGAPLALGAQVAPPGRPPTAVRIATRSTAPTATGPWCSTGASTILEPPRPAPCSPAQPLRAPASTRPRVHQPPGALLRIARLASPERRATPPAIAPTSPLHRVSSRVARRRWPAAAWTRPRARRGAIVRPSTVRIAAADSRSSGVTHQQKVQPCARTDVECHQRAALWTKWLASPEPTVVRDIAGARASRCSRSASAPMKQQRARLTHAPPRPHRVTAWMRRRAALARTANQIFATLHAQVWRSQVATCPALRLVVLRAVRPAQPLRTNRRATLARTATQSSENAKSATVQRSAVPRSSLAAPTEERRPATNRRLRAA
jgi:hypothetical protein